MLSCSGYWPNVVQKQFVHQLITLSCNGLWPGVAKNCMRPSLEEFVTQQTLAKCGPKVCPLLEDFVMQWTSAKCGPKICPSLEAFVMQQSLTKCGLNVFAPHQRSLSHSGVQPNVAQECAPHWRTLSCCRLNTEWRLPLVCSQLGTYSRGANYVLHLHPHSHRWVQLPSTQLCWYGKYGVQSTASFCDAPSRPFSDHPKGGLDAFPAMPLVRNANYCDGHKWSYAGICVRKKNSMRQQGTPSLPLIRGLLCTARNWSKWGYSNIWVVCWRATTMTPRPCRAILRRRKSSGQGLPVRWGQKTPPCESAEWFARQRWCQCYYLVVRRGVSHQGHWNSWMAFIIGQHGRWLACNPHTMVMDIRSICVMPGCWRRWGFTQYHTKLGLDGTPSLTALSIGPFSSFFKME